MTDNSPRKQIQRFIELMHPQLADFAQECFDTQGPGVIRVEIPVIAPTSLPDPFSTSMTAPQVRYVLSRLKVTSGEIDAVSV